MGEHLGFNEWVASLVPGGARKGGGGKGGISPRERERERRVSQLQKPPRGDVQIWRLLPHRGARFHPLPRASTPGCAAAGGFTRYYGDGRREEGGR